MYQGKVLKIWWMDVWLNKVMEEATRWVLEHEDDYIIDNICVEQIDLDWIITIYYYEE